MIRRHLLLAVVVGALYTPLSAQPVNAQTSGGVAKIPVVFSGGHDTDGQDRGRPVVLIAAALGVPTEVFREAFSHVHPAPAGTEPDEQQVRDNKRALMKALGKYGVNDEKLNEVSNHYRYARNRGELWPTRPAVANALVRNGVVTGYEIVDGGTGYSSPPSVSVPGVKSGEATVMLGFGKNRDKNGFVTQITAHLHGES